EDEEAPHQRRSFVVGHRSPTGAIFVLAAADYAHAWKALMRSRAFAVTEMPSRRVAAGQPLLLEVDAEDREPLARAVVGAVDEAGRGLVLARDDVALVAEVPPADRELPARRRAIGHRRVEEIGLG